MQRAVDNPQVTKLIRRLISHRYHDDFWAPADIKFWRWEYVRRGRTYCERLGGCEFQFATIVLKGTPAEGSWQQMKADFQAEERRMFRERRRGTKAVSQAEERRMFRARQPRIQRPRQLPAEARLIWESCVRSERRLAAFDPWWPTDRDEWKWTPPWAV